jgi:tRNA-Thr(GGU) m(6)t(6)A37 methyltransferase TsaA
MNDEGIAEIVFRPIGIIHSPFTETTGTPIQPCFADGAAGHVELFEEYAPGLADLDGFSHIHLIYHFHRSIGFSLKLTPYLDDTERGLFATRSPRRPNPIGLSVVRLERVEGRLLHVADLDVIDGTPLLDIKPFNPRVDHRGASSVGWMEGKGFSERNGRAGGRFTERGTKC